VSAPHGTNFFKKKEKNLSIEVESSWQGQEDIFRAMTKAALPPTHLSYLPYYWKTMFAGTHACTGDNFPYFHGAIGCACCETSIMDT
jgi:hypothetical protein